MALMSGVAAQAMTKESMLAAAVTGAAGFSALVEASQFSAGSQAIHDGRWGDAVKLMTPVASEHGEHAEAAQYWVAYAQSRLGKSKEAVASCDALKQAYPQSQWNQDCGALVIELQAGNGQAVQPGVEPNGELKLLALSAMMRQNEGHAVEELGKFLKGKWSETEKERALFVLAQGQSPAAVALLETTAGEGENAKLAAKAGQLLASRGKSPDQVRLSRVVGFDAIVTGKDGSPVTGLKREDFTVLDNGQPATVMTFRAAAPEDALSQVVIVLDTVNTGVLRTSMERTQLETFLRSNGGKLPYPVSIRFFGENGVVPIGPPSRDGNALADLLHGKEASFKPVRRAAGFYGAVEILQMSLAGLGTLAAEEAHQPGHKLVIWLSQGWPLLAGHDAWTTDKESVGFFQAVVSMSTALRRARITLDSIDPVVTPGDESIEWFKYKEYVKGVRNATKAQPGDMALQTLAEQSGGEVMNYTNEFLSDQLAHAVQRASGDYFLAFQPGPARQADEYHELKVTVNRPGMTVKARQGYYNEP